MENKKTISIKQYNKLLDMKQTLNNKGIIPILKRNKIKVGLGIICLSIAVFPNGLGALFYPLSFMLLGLSLFDLKNIHIPEFKRRFKNRLKGFWI